MALFNSIDLTASVGVPATHTFTTNQNVVIGWYIANTHTAGINVDVTLRGQSLGNGLEIPYQSTLIPLEGKVTCNTGDTLTVTITSAAGTADVTISVLEDAIPTP